MLPLRARYNPPQAVINTEPETPVGVRRDSAGPFLLRYVLFHLFLSFLSQAILFATHPHWNVHRPVRRWVRVQDSS